MRSTLNITPERARVLLSSIKELGGLSLEDLQQVTDSCHWRSYVPEQEIVRYQDPSTEVFFLVQGSLRVTHYSPSGHEVILCDLSAGEMFGELTAIDGLTRSALVVAKTDSITAFVSSSDFLKLLQSIPQFSLAILRRLTGQVRRLTHRVYDYSTLPVSARIHVELLRLAKTPPPPSNIGVISPAPTHTDIANTLSTHREAVTRELNKLARAGLIAKQGHELRILDMAELRRMVQKARNC
jgi:CRP/FNR family transcriptional regulator, cyclic AMP receptor protein